MQTPTAILKEIAYTVKGSWPFPTDMLRHDCARAATDADQAIISRLSREHAPDRAAFRDVQINLIAAEGWKPNTARWESFGWSVPSDEMHAMFKRWATANADLKKLAAEVLAKLTAAERDAIEWHFGQRH